MSVRARSTYASFTATIKLVGAGPRGSRDLDFEEARTAMAALLAGETTDAQAGAFLMLTAGAPSQKGIKRGIWAANDAMRQAERELARQAEIAYKRSVRDWHAAQAAKAGASATPGHASNRPSKGKAAADHKP